MIAPLLAVYVATKHDTNGNPRRGWLIVSTETGGATAFVEEGYNGRAALAKAGYPRIVTTGRIEVTPGEFREMCATGKRLKRGEP